MTQTDSQVVSSEATAVVCSDEFLPQTQAGVRAPYWARLLPIVSVQSFSLTAPLRTTRREGIDGREGKEGGGGDDEEQGRICRPKGTYCEPEKKPPNT